MLVNNAGILQIAPLLDITAETGTRRSPSTCAPMLLTTQVAAKAMIAEWPAARSSTWRAWAARSARPNQAHYAASKAAVISLTQVAAMELGAHGITVNCICPGYVLTEMGAATRTAGDGRGLVGEVAARAAAPSRPTSPAWPCSWRPTTPTTAPARR